jgi:hypothetical protein
MIGEIFQVSFENTDQLLLLLGAKVLPWKMLE